MLQYAETSIALVTGDWLLVFLFLLGIIVGSFLNVVIYRLHTNKSLNGSSHCLSCGVKLSWYELFPLFSYIFLKGSCRHCGAFIPPRYFFVELLTGVLFVLAGTMFSVSVLLLLHLILFSLIVVVLVYDLRHTIIPDEMVVWMIVVSVVIVFLTDGGGLWPPPLATLTTLLSGALIAPLFYASLWVISKGRWIGLGDAKLAMPLGLLVGWPLVVSLIIWSFWVGAILSLLLLWSKKLMRALGWGGKTILRFRVPSLTMKSEIPFAPFLMAAFLLTYVYQIDVFTIISGALGTVGL